MLNSDAAAVEASADCSGSLRAGMGTLEFSWIEVISYQIWVVPGKGAGYSLQLKQSKK